MNPVCSALQSKAKNQKSLRTSHRDRFLTSLVVMEFNLEWYSNGQGTVTKLISNFKMGKSTSSSCSTPCL